MGQIKRSTQYIYFILLLAFTTFEYFFRSNFFLPALSIFVIFDCILHYKLSVFNNKTIILLFSIFFINCLQLVFKDNLSIPGTIVPVVGLIGILCIARIINKSFIEIFINVITAIAFYSIIIYLLCYIPIIRDFLVGIARNFESINVEKAVQEGGGLNFIIYNFQTDFLSDIIGFYRNSGPFWEPGMFAVFLIIALFFNLFLSDRHNHIITIILISAIISTFSTGGYLCSILLLAFYSFNIGIKWRNIIIILPLSIYIGVQIMELDYIGNKTMEQFNTATKGSDSSRYGAFITQLDMIEGSPIIGGEKIVDYATSKTLSSGVLFPMVSYGIPVGLLYYIFLYKACINITVLNKKKKYVGRELFILIMVLSFSQTILMMGPILLLTLNGLTIKNCTNVLNTNRSLYF